ncbi:MAG: tyrosine-type recombinase/integrase [Raineya sp.]|jgi:site-specific recombinase XerD|nr:tyrosine-type recombinase/integrase [Raineya sp.]
MNVLFWIRKNYQNRKGTCQIKCSVSIAGSRKEFSTKLHIEPANWNQKRQKAKGNEALYINDALQKIESKLISIKREFEKLDRIVTPVFIVDAYLNKTKTECFISTLYQYLKTEKKEVLEINTLKAYEARKKNVIEIIGDVNIKVLEFFHFDTLITEMRKKDFAIKTMKRHLSDLQNGLKIALKKGFKFDNTLFHFSANLGKETTKELIYLNEKELELIRGVKLQNTKLENTRLLFCLQTLLSCSYIELKRIILNPHAFIENDLIVITRQKTKVSTQIIPYTKELEKLLFYSKIKIISNAKYNEYLKELAKELKINKRLTTHTARKTGGNEYIRKGFDAVETQKILGHKKITESFDSYLEITKEQIRKKSKKIQK